MLYREIIAVCSEINTYVCGRSLAEIAGSIPAGSMDIFLL